MVFLKYSFFHFILISVFKCNKDMWCLKRLEEGVKFHGHGVTYCCQLLHGGWELNPGPLENHQLLLSVELSFELSEIDIHKYYEYLQHYRRFVLFLTENRFYLCYIFGWQFLFLLLLPVPSKLLSSDTTSFLFLIRK